MGPNIEAAIQFLESGGKRALIASTENIERSIQGKAGTEIIR
jgi:carbamate kinase